MKRLLPTTLRRSLLLLFLLLTAAAGYAQDDGTQPGTDPGAAPDNTDNLSNYQSQIIRAREELDELDKIRQKIRTAISIGNFVKKLDDLQAIEFPVVLGDTISGVPIYVTFDNLRLYPEYAQLAVYVMVETPQREIEGSGSPDEYTTLLFGSPDVKFSHDGGIIGDAKIGLLADYPIKTKNPDKVAFVLKKTASVPDRNNGSGATQDVGTYVRIDCDGFVEMGLAADITFSADWIVPVDRNKQPIRGGRVKTSISTIITDWNNMLFEVDLPNFAMTKFPDASFNLRTAVFDFSDYRNSPNIVWPQGYVQRYLPPGNVNIWRGIYIKELSVTLPKQFEDCTAARNNGSGGSNGSGTPGNGSGNGTGALMLDHTGTYAYRYTSPLTDLAARSQPGGPSPPPAPAAPPQKLDSIQTMDDCRVSVKVNHLMVDFGVGLSGQLEAENVLGNGDMDSWPFTVEDLKIKIVANRLHGFGFGGKVRTSLNAEGKAFDYKAFINPPDRQYNFRLETNESFDFEVFKLASVRIDSSSYLNVNVIDGKFKPSAVLTGHAAIIAKLGSTENDKNLPEDKQTFNAPRIEFKKLYVSTDPARPIGLVQGGSLKFKGPPVLINFPLTVADPKLMDKGNGEVAIGATVRLNLLSQQDNGFAAEADVNLNGRLSGGGPFKKWQTTGLSVSRILVDINTPGMSLNGYAHIFDENPIYGKGFQGGLRVAVGKEPRDNPMLVVELNAMFGQTDFKYWYVDGMVEADALDVPLIPGVLHANGFGGGAYYHMEMVGADLINGSDGSLGAMPSGVIYEPNENIVLGLKAAVALASPGPTETLDGFASLELAFANTGLQDIMFYGRIEVVSPAGDSWMAKKQESMEKQVGRLMEGTADARRKAERDIQNQPDVILGAIFLRMNFEQGFEFQGTFEAYVSAAQNKLVGGGEIDILISKPQNRWHLYVGGYTDGSVEANDGTPLYPVHVTVNLGSGITGSAGCYFLMGNDIPGPPPIDPEVAAWFGESTRQNERGGSLDSQTARGKGFAFGAFVKASIDVYLTDSSRSRRRRRNYLKGQLGAGFDISLLHYERNTRCNADSRKSPHGHKGWRATGRLWAYADVHGRKLGKRFDLAIGIKVEGDLPNPTYLSMRVRVRVFGIGINVPVKIGDRCGRPVYAYQDPFKPDYRYAELSTPFAPPTAAAYQFVGHGPGGGGSH